MSNLTLKEQLLALSLGTSSASEVSEKKQKEPKSQPTMKKKPIWLEHAQYGVELLRAYYSNCFKEMKEIKPLKVGIKQDLVKHLSTREDIVLSDKACMVNSLAYYVGSIAYHRSMVEGATRIDLDGHVAGTVSKEDAAYSQECLQTKSKRKEDKIKRE